MADAHHVFNHAEYPAIVLKLGASCMSGTSSSTFRIEGGLRSLQGTCKMVPAEGASKQVVLTPNAERLGEGCGLLDTEEMTFVAAPLPDGSASARWLDEPSE